MRFSTLKKEAGRSC